MTKDTDTIEAATERIMALMESRTTDLTDKLERYEKALKHYADIKNWFPDDNDHGIVREYGAFSDDTLNGPDIAREALAAIGGTK